MSESRQVSKSDCIGTTVPVPLVTIAMPTYNRPELLKRALASAVAQDYPNLEILVSDNATPGNASDAVVAKFAALDSRITYFKQETNMGPAANFRFLLDKACGVFFMWLADDDFISQNYVSELSRMLASGPSISCASAHYKLISRTGNNISKGGHDFPSRSVYRRSLHYIFRADDSSCYGLQRTELLRPIRFAQWWWPNKNVLLDIAYPFLFEVMCEGRICLTPVESVEWIKDDRAPKAYFSGIDNWVGFLQFFIRRVNLYWEYVRRAFLRKHFFLALMVAMIAPFALIKDYSLCVGPWLLQKLRVRISA